MAIDSEWRMMVDEETAGRFSGIVDRFPAGEHQLVDIQIGENFASVWQVKATRLDVDGARTMVISATDPSGKISKYDLLVRDTGDVTLFGHPDNHPELDGPLVARLVEIAASENLE